jgi:hypothetical protein
MSRRLPIALACPSAALLAAALLGVDAPVVLACGMVAGSVLLAWPSRRRRPELVVGRLGRPRRGRPPLAITVASIARTAPAVQGIAPRAASGPVRVVGRRTRYADPALVAAAWDLATRKRAALADAAALELGLADEPLPRRAPSGPDPVLVAAIGA